MLWLPCAIAVTINLFATASPTPCQRLRKIGNKLATPAAALARINLRSNFALDALIQLIGFAVY